MEYAVIVSVLVLIVLSLFRLNVILALMGAAVTAGLLAGLSFTDSIEMLVSGMGGRADTALSYILLGVFAVMIGYSGITGFLVTNLVKLLKNKRAALLLTIAGVACLSQNLIPVHIAFIPILIPPLLHLFDHMKINRRAVAVSLTFGLKAPYILLPVGYGLIFQNIIQESMNENGMNIAFGQIWQAMIIPVGGMVIGLLIAVFVTYRKDKETNTGNIDVTEAEASLKDTKRFQLSHLLTLIAIVSALLVQVWTESLVIGALTGIAAMFIFRVVPVKEADQTVNDGVRMMGMIAFVMLLASGYATVLQDTGAVEQLVAVTSDVLGGSQLLGAVVMLLTGLLITMGIGSSFGTIPILAALFVPLSASLGFSPLATAALIGTAGAIGDAGSPASDSTLGPTAGLNADGHHDHIWDTCVPTFLHFNIPLFICGLAAAFLL
ncbi:Na+/H+ antiporter family protein [Marinococcus halotolerans]|uniref:Na+/H+ antiporter family protein n=1 Tax=Marinococcus halotolerans TaxID=301092 RepID=UPI0003B79C6A|nr:Na+/H+ antiporter NhaC family protein [Marinococcus halotolerans]